MSSSKVKVIYGTFPVSEWTPELRQEVIKLLRKYNVKDLDTAHHYPNSEETLHSMGVTKEFTIHTKAPGFVPGSLSHQSIQDGMAKSLSSLGIPSVETYFLHSPDPQTPLPETLASIQELYQAGKFKYFGLSNFKPEDVQKIHDHAQQKGYVLPTVYQGNYNPVARLYEKTLFPMLRKLNIRFYAYSPIAGGFLVRDPDSILAGEGRFDRSTQIGKIYQKLYNKPSLVKALHEWADIAKDAGISKAALAYRWVEFHGALKAEDGDAMIIGSRPAQLEETLMALEDGPLDGKIAERVEGVWKMVEHEAPLDNYNDML